VRRGVTRKPNTLAKLAFLPHSSAQLCDCKTVHELYTQATFTQITCIWLFDVRKSVHHHTIQNKLTNKLQQFYKFITWRFVSLNMFRSPPRPSSEAYNCINSLWFYRWSVVVAMLLVVVWPARPQPITLLPPTLQPEDVKAVVSSWWWAWRRPKHVKRHKTSSNKLVKLLHLVG